VLIFRVLRTRREYKRPWAECHQALSDPNLIPFVIPVKFIRQKRVHIIFNNHIQPLAARYQQVVVLNASVWVQPHAPISHINKTHNNQIICLHTFSTQFNKRKIQRSISFWQESPCRPIGIQAVFYQSKCRYRPDDNHRSGNLKSKNAKYSNVSPQQYQTSVTLSLSTSDRTVMLTTTPIGKFITWPPQHLSIGTPFRPNFA
jgi:hypothetical protein